MSKQFLYSLNGDNQAGFKNFLDKFSGQPRIAWYPSAGLDFRALLYLSGYNCKLFPPLESLLLSEPGSPDIFLYTDCNEDFFNSNFNHLGIEIPKSKFLATLGDAEDLGAWALFDDGRTRIEVKYFENLPEISCRSDKEIVCCSSKRPLRKVVYVELKVISNVLGTYKVPLVYINAENEGFCSKYLLGNTSISHVIHVRYGGGMGGGGYASGVWLKNVLKNLQTEVFITDGHHDLQDGDNAALKLYPNLKGNKETCPMLMYKTVSDVSWSNHGDVKWNLVLKT